MQAGRTFLLGAATRFAEARLGAPPAFPTYAQAAHIATFLQPRYLRQRLDFAEQFPHLLPNTGTDPTSPSIIWRMLDAESQVIDVFVAIGATAMESAGRDRFTSPEFRTRFGAILQDIRSASGSAAYAVDVTVDRLLLHSLTANPKAFDFSQGEDGVSRPLRMAKDFLRGLDELKNSHFAQFDALRSGLAYAAFWEDPSLPEIVSQVTGVDIRLAVDLAIDRLPAENQPYGSERQRLQGMCSALAAEFPGPATSRRYFTDLARTASALTSMAPLIPDSPPNLDLGLGHSILFG